MPLSLHDFQAREFRSLKKIAYPMSDLDVFVGENGVGKTNLYRALELLRSAAANTLARDLAHEGGLESAMWAGKRRRGQPARLRLSVGLADRARRSADGLVYRYEVEVGFPQMVTDPAFDTEPQIKAEAVSVQGEARSIRLVDRQGPSVMARDEAGRPAQIDMDLLASETVLGRLEDPSHYPELDSLRRTLLQWRFYHGLRTDAASPLRQPCAAVATPALASDGSDLAAVFATLAHIRQDTSDLDRVVDEAFPGARLVVPPPGRWASFGMTFPEFPQRVFDARELSDGTLRFLGLAGALLAYRLPPFIALNEPEGSLHPDLMAPLARLVVGAAQRTQLWLVTHSTPLAEAIAKTGAGKVRQVVKEDGATRIEGLKAWGEFEQDDEG
jgi:predicted ATPase